MTTNNDDQAWYTEKAINAVKAERERQKTKWSVEHDTHHELNDWIGFILTYALDAQDHPALADKRFAQIGALAIAALESLNRNRIEALP